MEHWMSRVSECIASFPQKLEKGQDIGPLAIKGGSENGLFCIVADVKHAKITYHTDGRLQVDTIILEVQGQKVAGYTQKDIVAWIRKVCHNGAPVMFKTASPCGALVADLKVYLSGRFQKGSPDHDLQLTIRDNLYQRTVPCTTRPPRAGEVDGIDYTFLTIKEFAELEKSGGLLESGLFDGNYYGTPKPSTDNQTVVKRTANGSLPLAQPLSASARSSEEKRRRNRSSIEATGGVDEGLSPTETATRAAAASKGKEPIAAKRTHSSASSGRGSQRDAGDSDSDEDAGVPSPRGGATFSSPVPNGRDGPSNGNNRAKGQPGGESDDDEILELPVGWERVVDPKYGTYYIDHVNRTTQYDHPLSSVQSGGVASARKSPALSQKSAASRDVGLSRSARASPVSSAAGGRLSTARGMVVTKVSPFFTKNPAELRGEKLRTALIKSPRGFGFTIVGSDEPDVEFLQIKHVLSNGPAHQDRVLQTGDVLVTLNGKCVLGYTHADVVSLFQGIKPGEKLNLEVCRGYPLSFDPTDPNTEIVTTVAVTKPEPSSVPAAAASSTGDSSSSAGSDSERASPAMSRGGQGSAAGVQGGRQGLASRNDGDNDSLKEYANALVHDLSQKSQSVERELSVSPPANGDRTAAVMQEDVVAGSAVGPAPELLSMQIVRGPEGFGFTIADSVHGQKVKSVLDRGRCRYLLEGDILSEIDGISVKQSNHNDVVRVLKSCPLGRETTIVVERGVVGSGKAGRSNSNSGGSTKRVVPEPSGQAGASGIAVGQGVSNHGNATGEGGPKGPSAAPPRQRQPSTDEDSDFSNSTPPVPAKSHSSTMTNGVQQSTTANHLLEAANNRNEQHKLLSTPRGSSSGTEVAAAAPQPVEPGYLLAAAGPSAVSNPSESTKQQPANPVVGNVAAGPAITITDAGRGDSAVKQPVQAGAAHASKQPESVYSYPIRHQQWVYDGDLDLPAAQQTASGQDSHGLQQPPVEQSRPLAADMPRRARTPGPETMSTLDPQPLHDSRFRSKTPNPIEDRRIRQAVERATPGSQAFAVEGNDWRMAGPQIGPGGSHGHGTAAGGEAGLHAYQQIPAMARDLAVAQSGARSQGSLPIYREQVVELEVTLHRQESGFGFRIVGGPEEGTQVAIGHVVPRGAADVDGRLQTGDEIIAVDGVSTLGESHHRVVQLMGGSASRGRVDMRVRRRMLIQASPPVRPMPAPQSADPARPYDVTITRGENEGFGFVIVSSVARPDAPEGAFKIGRINDDSPAMRNGCLHVGDRIVAVNGRGIAGLQHEEIVNIIKESGFQVTLTVAPPAIYGTTTSYDGGPYGTLTSATALPAMGESDTLLRLGAARPSTGMQRPLAPDIWRGNTNYTDSYAGNQQLNGSATGSARNGPSATSPSTHSLLPVPNVGYPSSSHQQTQAQRSREGSAVPGSVSFAVQSSGHGQAVAEPVATGLSNEGGAVVFTIELPRGFRGFGFSIRGGQEFNNMPLYVLRIADDGAAKLDGRLRVGDELLEINGYRTIGMTHADAINRIQNGGSLVRLTIRRTGQAPAASDSPQTSPSALTSAKSLSPEAQVAARVPDGSAVPFAGRSTFEPLSPTNYKVSTGALPLSATNQGSYRIGYDQPMPNGGAPISTSFSFNERSASAPQLRPHGPGLEGSSSSAAVPRTGPWGSGAQQPRPGGRSLYEQMPPARTQQPFAGPPDHYASSNLTGNANYVTHGYSQQQMLMQMQQQQPQHHHSYMGHPSSLPNQPPTSAPGWPGARPSGGQRYAPVAQDPRYQYASRTALQPPDPRRPPPTQAAGYGYQHSSGAEPRMSSGGSMQPLHPRAPLSPTYAYGATYGSMRLPARQDFVGPVAIGSRVMRPPQGHVQGHAQPQSRGQVPQQLQHTAAVAHSSQARFQHQPAVGAASSRPEGFYGTYGPPSQPGMQR